MIRWTKKKKKEKKKKKTLGEKGKKKTDSRAGSVGGILTRISLIGCHVSLDLIYHFTPLKILPTAW
jgi:hypothetical protein